MNILHVTTTDKGGAGSAAFNLHINFSKRDYDSRMIVLNKGSEDSSCYEFNYGVFDFVKRFEKKLKHYYHQGVNKNNIPKYHFYNYSESANYASPKRILKTVKFHPDIIIVHYISHFANFKTVQELQELTGAKVIWHLLDMSLLTGGCHYAWDCLGYTSKCGKCPALSSTLNNDAADHNLQEKINYNLLTNSEVVAPTQHLFEQCKKSILFKNHVIHKIPLSVDEKVFEPISKKECREKLNIPQGKKVIFFGSQSLKDERKGMPYLLKALEELDIIAPLLVKENLLLVIAGNVSGEIKWPFEHQYIGYLKEPRTLSMAYQAADFFACPSIEDSGPMMINESMMCGTPVVSFEMGAAKDFVTNYETGFKAELRNSTELAKGLLNLLNYTDEEYYILRKNCRNLALTTLTHKAQLNQFELIINSSN